MQVLAEILNDLSSFQRKKKEKLVLS